ncbi:MAG: hypothetical protein CMI16_06925 [Opitutaceae bacterium]|nr:hypothetical protein [Opitutaceae bacterium]
MSEVTVPPRRDGGITRTRDPPLFAELRRVTTWAPSTDTLPSTIPLQATDEARVVTIGREGSDVILDARESIERILSRKHAEIAFDPETGAHTVNDLDTLNGTYHNGNLLSRGPLVLQHGDIIGFGGPANVSSRFPTPSRSESIHHTRPRRPKTLVRCEITSSASRVFSILTESPVPPIVSNRSCRQTTPHSRTLFVTSTGELVRSPNGRSWRRRREVLRASGRRSPRVSRETRRRAACTFTMTTTTSSSRPRSELRMPGRPSSLRRGSTPRGVRRGARAPLRRLGLAFEP